MSVRPPGYYVSWYHFVGDIPNGSKNVNIYDFIVANSYWNSSSKKLNAIITVPAGATITADGIGNINASPAPTGSQAAVYVPPTKGFGQGSFRSYDRVTLIIKGKLVGAYGTKNYSGTGTFTPPAAVMSGTDTVNFAVTTVSATVKAGGGSGGSGTDSGCAAGGGGGGSGGANSGSVNVTAGTEMTASGGGAGEDASYKQGATSRISATKGSNGGDASGGGSREACAAIAFSFFCRTILKPATPGKGGNGGSPNGSKGGDGGARSSECQDRACGSAKGGNGGSGGGGSGGKGGDGCGSGGGSGGKGGGHSYSYTRTELYGPGLVVAHENTFVDNDLGRIIGGYASPQRYAVYGQNNIKRTSTSKALSDTNIVGGIAATAV